MKLTKGKLSKIRNKKNQSAKRFKNTGKGRKTKTFRKRKALSLHNTSLKKYNGGQGTKSSELDDPTKPEKIADSTTDVVDEPSMEPIVAPTTDVVGEPSMEPIVAPTTDVVDEPSMEPIVAPTTDVVGEPSMEPIVAPTTDVVGEPSMEPVVLPTTDLEDPGEGPGSHQELPAPVSEVGSDLAEVSPAAKEEMIKEKPTSDATGATDAENGLNATTETGSEETSSITEEPISQKQSIGNDLSIVAESLDRLAEYISDKIAKKLNLGSGSLSTELNNDSFNTVANANEALVEA
jgi:hypothetical protein